MTYDYQQAEADAPNAFGDLMLRASTDLGFRAQLLADPREALAEFTGTEIPATMDIRFIENAADVDATFVLPDAIDPEAELSPEELEAVAGGVSDVLTTIATVLAAAASVTAVWAALDD